MKKFVFLTSIIFLLNACSKNEVDLPQPDEVNQNLTIDEVKAFYMSNAKHLRTSENDKGKLVFCDDYIEYEGSDGSDYLSIEHIDLNGLAIDISDSRKKEKKRIGFSI